MTIFIQNEGLKVINSVKEDSVIAVATLDMLRCWNTAPNGRTIAGLVHEG